MNNTFKKILLVSDLDGTLIGENFQIPQRNLDALARFQSQGGNFAIATGRSIDSTQRYVSMVHPNTPCIIFNGAAIYDYRLEKIIWSHPLPSQSMQYFQDLRERFPEVGMEICTDFGINIIQDNSYVQDHVSHEKLKHLHCDLEHTQGTWFKGFFAMKPELLAQVSDYMEHKEHEGVRFVSSSDYYYEMLPDGVDKGSALIKLAELQNIDVKHIYAAGDYYNDLELLSVAGTSAVPQNAPDEVKKIADMVVCHCRDGAIADIIEHLEKNADKL